MTNIQNDALYQEESNLFQGKRDVKIPKSGIRYINAMGAMYSQR